MTANVNGHNFAAADGASARGNAHAALAAVVRSGSKRGALTILLVDDDEDCRSIIRDAIRDAVPRGVEEPHIVEMPDGAAAVAYLTRVADAAAAGDPEASLGMPGLVFLDVEMPRLNGLDTLAAIKAMPAMSGVPVVMLTGVADEAHMRDAARRGANSYTIKPASAEQFIDTVRASANYWLTIHQYPTHHLPQAAARR